MRANILHLAMERVHYGFAQQGDVRYGTDARQCLCQVTSTGEMQTRTFSDAIIANR